MSEVNGTGSGDLEFKTTARHSSAQRAGTRPTRPPMPVVSDAHLLAPQRLPALRGFWWKPDNWQTHGTGKFVSQFDPLTANAQYLVEVAFGSMHGWPKPVSPEKCVEDFAREYGRRAAKSLQWRKRPAVTEAKLVSVYRTFLTRHLIGTTTTASEPAIILDMEAFKKRRADAVAAQAAAERARIAENIVMDDTGQYSLLMPEQHPKQAAR